MVLSVLGLQKDRGSDKSAGSSGLESLNSLRPMHAAACHGQRGACCMKSGASAGTGATESRINSFLAQNYECGGAAGEQARQRNGPALYCVHTRMRCEKGGEAGPARTEICHMPAAFSRSTNERMTGRNKKGLWRGVRSARVRARLGKLDYFFLYPTTSTGRVFFVESFA